MTDTASSPGPTLPVSYPAWARELADLYFSGTTCVFVLHGNVHDLMRLPAEGEIQYGSLTDFLASQLFGSWDIVLHYDLGRGLRPLAGNDAVRLKGMLKHLTPRLGEPGFWPRDPDAVLFALDRLLEGNLLEQDPDKRKRIAILLDYAQYLVPAGELSSLSRGQGTSVVRLLGWAQNPYLKRINAAICLLTDKLAEVNDRLVQNPHVAAIDIPLPDRFDREHFCRSIDLRDGSTDLQAGQVADISNGLTLVNLQVLLSQGRQGTRGFDPARFRRLKKTLIERQCQGLVEFIEPGHTLDMVVGLQAAKDRLRQDADLIARGRLDAAPMGYLLCGPVGTGKSFLAECYAGSVGIPCVKLRNFRSKYVGETEGNLEQVLTVLRSLGPVVVLIDEADATLGTRETGGDSGTSSRVFGMIASQMGDTRYRGRIIWMLVTSRPERLPIDLKRQGRAEVHIPLFYPQDEAELREMFLAMARKNKVALTAEEIPPLRPEQHLSGSDVESIVLTAQRQALSSGRDDVERADLEAALAEFLPSTQGLEKEIQEIAAVLECTQLSFLPERWRLQVTQPNGRTRIQERYHALRRLLGED